MESLRNTPIVLFTLLLCWSIPSFSVEKSESEFDFRPSTIIGSPTLDLDCQIKDQTVLSVEDGQPKSYSGVEGSYGKGDTLSVRLTKDFEESPSLVFLSTHYGEKTLTEGVFLLTDLEVHSNQKGGVHPTLPYYVYFTDDQIRIINDLGRTQINLRRYYKSDWGGYISIGPTNLTKQFFVINSVDCRTNINNLMDLLQYGKL